MSSFIIPEDLLNQHDFALLQPRLDASKLALLKSIVLAKVNASYLRHLKANGRAPAAKTTIAEIEELANDTAASMVDGVVPKASSSKGKKEGKKDGDKKSTEQQVAWAKDPANVALFSAFVAAHYEPTEKPETKFHLLLKDFAKTPEGAKLDMRTIWNSAYESLPVKRETIITANTKTKREIKTMYVFLKRKELPAPSLPVPVPLPAPAVLPAPALPQQAPAPAVLPPQVAPASALPPIVATSGLPPLAPAIPAAGLTATAISNL
jgi:hypothetical protein